MKPRLLDLFCGAGGASVGYARAGFEVVGVDIKPQPHYPFEFIQADALELEFIQDDALEFMEGLPPGSFNAIHASPPCQPFSRGRKVANGPGTTALDLVEPTRALLAASGLPYVIENVEGAPLIDPVRLCGSSFALAVRRHRLFESNVTLYGSDCRHREQGRPVGVYHQMADQVKGIDHTTGLTVYGGRTASTLEEGQAAMGIDWMQWRELCESIPPAYTERIGRQVVDFLSGAGRSAGKSRPSSAALVQATASAQLPLELL